MEKSVIRINEPQLQLKNVSIAGRIVARSMGVTPAQPTVDERRGARFDGIYIGITHGPTLHRDFSRLHRGKVLLSST